MKNIGEEKNELSFLDHLEVLRWHLIRSSFAIFIFTILASSGITTINLIGSPIPRPPGRLEARIV